jgi:hypothetical protein
MMEGMVGKAFQLMAARKKRTGAENNPSKMCPQ